jgi:hypothetical protein
MQRLTNRPLHQLALHLEAPPRHPLDSETREALISALADLLLEAYGAQTSASGAEPDAGAGHEF